MKRIVATVLFALLFIGGFRPMFLRLIVSRRSLHQPGPENGLDRHPLREREDPTSPELHAFLERVRSQTRPGDSIALVFAPPDAGFSYNYWCANYMLSGRTVKFPGDTDADVIARWPPGTIERQR
jgi:hypothetical protein